MKLSITPSLDDIRKSALAEVENIAAANFTYNNRFSAAYAAKLQQATTFVISGSVPQELAIEATKKNMYLPDLCAAIQSRSEETRIKNSSYELERQKAKLAIQVAPDEQQIKLAIELFKKVNWGDLNEPLLKPISATNSYGLSEEDCIFLDNTEFAEKIASELNITYRPNLDHSLTRVKHGKLLGGVIYQSYTGPSIELFMAGLDPHWVSRDLIWATFAYPFIQLKCSKLIGRVADTNKRALNMELKLGFKEEGRIKNAVTGGDILILTMKREDCKWLLRISPRTRFWDYPQGRLHISYCNI